jgi:energy-coupling factor transport system ATP-binding protein
MPKIDIDHLWFRYRGAPDWALRDVSLKVEEGEFVAVMGPAGAGKTTLCMTLDGIIPHSLVGPFKGRVIIDGEDTRTTLVSHLATKVGMTFQDLEAQFFGLTVEEEIAFGPENLSVPRSEMRQRLEESLDIVRMKDYRNNSPWELSGGQKQRVAIASALVMRPQILVMDEPTSELDPIGKKEIFSVIETLRNEYRMTIVLVEHEAEQIAKYADRVLLIENGELKDDSEPREFFSKIVENKSKRVRCPQVTELAYSLRQSQLWPWQLPILLDDGVNRLRQMLQETKRDNKSTAMPAVPQQPDALHSTVIEVRDLEYSYPNGFEALHGINLDIHRGELVAIIGQNGSGKTTLVKHFNGLLKPTRGSVKVLGKETKSMTVAELSRSVGYAFQNPDHQIFTESVTEEVAYGPRNLGLSEKEVKETVDETLTFMGLDKFRSEHPLYLGKGERKLLTLCSVLAMKPDVLVLDEPTTGQDFASALKVSDAVRRINGEGKTVILVTHDMRLVADLAKRTVVMMQGKILLDASTFSAFGQPEILTQSFIEPPQIVALSNALRDYGFPTCLGVSDMQQTLERALHSLAPLRL